MAAPSSWASNVVKVLGIVGIALWCVGLGLAIGYAYSKPTTPESSRGRTYALWRPGRGAVYLTKPEYVSLGIIWGAGTVLLVAGLQGATRLARTRRQPPRPPRDAVT